MLRVSSSKRCTLQRIAPKSINLTAKTSQASIDVPKLLVCAKNPSHLKNIYLKSYSLNSMSRRSFHSIPAAKLKYSTPLKQKEQKEDDLDEGLNQEREVDNVDVCIVGGGPAGLTTAIKLKQLDTEGKLRIVVLEKAADLGSHIVSGAVIEPRSLRELFPKEQYEELYEISDDNIPLPSYIYTKAKSDKMRFLTDDFSIPLPEPSHMQNAKNGNVIVSLNGFTKYLAEQAEELGVEIYPAISVSEVVYDESGKFVKGVATKDLGIGKDGKPTENFERGMEFHAKVTVLSEGCHGSLSKQVISKFNLRENKSMQTYGLGIKEVWELDPSVHQNGLVAHSIGYPLTNLAYGGGFMYHFTAGKEEKKLYCAVGMVIGLDYENPWINPYKEFQLMKHHPFYHDVLSHNNNKCISYAARTLNEGGLQSVPKLYFPGGVLVGASAGFMNVAKIKGTHTAMKSGLLAAEEIFQKIKLLPGRSEMEEWLEEEKETDVEAAEQTIKSALPITVAGYQSAFENSWAYDELHEVRNIRPSFNSPLGIYGGLLYSGLDTMFLKGKTGFTLNHHQKSDAECTGTINQFPERIVYPKPDNKVSFELLTSVNRSGTYHSENEECHLRITEDDKNPMDKFKFRGVNTKALLEEHAKKCYPAYKGVENRFCPAGVYEYDEKPNGEVKFVINSQNCVHCKTCDIKVPTQDINWSVPEGGDGPKYFMT